MREWTRDLQTTHNTKTVIIIYKCLIYNNNLKEIPDTLNVYMWKCLHVCVCIDIILTFLKATWGTWALISYQILTAGHWLSHILTYLAILCRSHGGLPLPCRSIPGSFLPGRVLVRLGSGFLPFFSSQVMGYSLQIVAPTYTVLLR